MRRVAFLLALIVCASGALAQQQRWVHVVPSTPTSADPLELHIVVSCPYLHSDVQRTGDLIRVYFAFDDKCAAALVLPSIRKVPIGELPPGTYRVEVRFSDNAIVAQTKFVVRHAGPKPFEIHPFAVPVSGAGLRMRLSGGLCGANDCSVRVGDTTIANLERRLDGSLWFTAPPHAEGLVDVAVQIGDAVQVSPAALYYFDEDLSVFERILFPILDRANGANGSRWVTEAVISNPRSWSVLAASSVIPIDCVVYPCGELLMPGATAQFEGRDYPHGVIWGVPPPEAPDLALALRVRDVSRQTEGFGTRIPVVREAEMFHGRTITLLDVPLDPRYRVKLRIYAIETFTNMEQGRLKIVRGESTETITFEMTEPDSVFPAYAEIDLPAGAAGERAHLIIDPPLDAIAWAFASVTNNETQQVTIVAPE